MSFPTSQTGWTSANNVGRTGHHAPAVAAHHRRRPHVDEREQSAPAELHCPSPAETRNLRMQAADRMELGLDVQSASMAATSRRTSARLESAACASVSSASARRAASARAFACGPGRRRCRPRARRRRRARSPGRATPRRTHRAPRSAPARRPTARGAPTSRRARRGTARDHEGTRSRRRRACARSPCRPRRHRAPAPVKRAALPRPAQLSWSVLALASTLSTPPTLKNACSGTWSSSPLLSASNASTVSATGT